MCHKLLSRTHNALLFHWSLMNSDAVRGPEHCTINSTPPGVSRALGTDGTMSNGEAMDNMNITLGH